MAFYINFRNSQRTQGIGPALRVLKLRYLVFGATPNAVKHFYTSSRSTIYGIPLGSWFREKPDAKERSLTSTGFSRNQLHFLVQNASQRWPKVRQFARNEFKLSDLRPLRSILLHTQSCGMG